MKIVYDYSKLKGRITEKCETIGKFATLINISENGLRKKMKNECYFTQRDIQKAISSNVLDINPKEISIYFFNQKVGKNKTEDK